jgi:hypothetical protein
MLASEKGCPLSQKFACALTSRSQVTTVPSLAETTTFGSRGAATGRNSGLIWRWKKAFHDLKPPCGA